MNSILQDLYYGHIDPESEMQGISGTWNNFSSELKVQAPSLWKSFDALMDDTTEAYHFDTEHMFCLGFNLAVKLLTGALAY